MKALGLLKMTSKETANRAFVRLVGGKSTGRDDWIRTSDPYTPSIVRYQTAPHPDTSGEAPIGARDDAGKQVS